MINMIQTILNEPVALTSNTSPITFDITNIRTRCAYCCNGGWLDYQNGNPIFKIFGNNYTGYYDVNFSATVSSATAGVVAIGLYEDGILIPDTVRAVTIAAADDLETVSFNRKIKICPRGNTSITVGSVPSVPTPTTPATPIATEIPIIVSGTFNIARE
jgi:hypothetical protein